MPAGRSSRPDNRKVKKAITRQKQRAALTARVKKRKPAKGNEATQKKNTTKVSTSAKARADAKTIKDSKLRNVTRRTAKQVGDNLLLDGSSARTRERIKRKKRK